MRNTPGPSDSFESSHLPNFHEIQEVERGKAKAAWEKLEENGNRFDQILIHPQLVFYCTKNSKNDELTESHYFIDVFGPNGDPNVDTPKTEVLLIQDRDGSVSLHQHVAIALPLSPLEANHLLERIAASTSKA